MTKQERYQEELAFLRDAIIKCQNTINIKGLTVSTGFGATKRIEPNPALDTYIDLIDRYNNVLEKVDK